MVAADDTPTLVNRGESKEFIKTALAWVGSVSPRVLPRVGFATLYSVLAFATVQAFPAFQMSITPFEYSGAVLGLLLVIRVNAGHDRWWEARKIWGSIVNQSRNLAIIGYAYSSAGAATRRHYLAWVASWPHVMRESLRKTATLVEVTKLLGAKEAARIRSAQHMPTYVGLRIALLIKELRDFGLDDFAFQRAERERALLIDAIGASERIRNTPFPYALAIKTRRFIFLFLLLLPFALAAKLGAFTPCVVALAAYPLFALDEIGAELQNPFSPRNLSHLPLGGICQAIEANVLALPDGLEHLERRDLGHKEAGSPFGPHSYVG